ncbi:class I SAM-dependent methyltransferase [Nonomuraea jiangxiensis]|uniref:Methyltransferase domain-containing protein n=1 Tax=Nonomuraea jiangxiensis TaxID=633440 RepID=A0A1G8CQ44_9ACTN|nr:class I SAM-dependent methyltransferase [Nonomuraea jiangxiensis]SDH47605.1 hypothetical protein SAMN05421869_102362 [Nonomuraea jiangxiensis]
MTARDPDADAVRLARERFPGSGVRYEAADLLSPPAAWRRAFDLVVEIMTVQALPEELHARATAAVSEFVRPGGTRDLPPAHLKPPDRNLKTYSESAWDPGRLHADGAGAQVVAEDFGQAVEVGARVEDGLADVVHPVGHVLPGSARHDRGEGGDQGDGGEQVNATVHGDLQNR